VTEVPRKTVVVVGLAAGAVFLAGAIRSPWLGLAAMVSLAGFIAILREPGIGMGLLTFLFPLERMQRITNDDATFTISLMRLVALACLASLLLARIHERRSLRLDSSILVYGLYSLLAVSGLLYSTDPYGTKRAVGTILSNGLLLILYLNYLQTRRQIHLTLAIWIAANLVGAAYSAFDWHFGSGVSGAEKLVDPGQGTQTTLTRWSTVWEDITEWEAQGGAALRRSMGPTSHAAVYGINLVLTIPFFFYLLHRHRKAWQQIGLTLGLGLIFYNIILTNTRASLLVAAFTCGLCVITGLFRIRTPHVLAALLCLLAFLPVVPRDSLERMLDPRNYSAANSATLRIRFECWSAALRIIENHFFFGIGAGNTRAFPEELKNLEIGDNIYSAHNAFLQAALETGILGWLLFFGFVGLIFYYTRVAAQRLRYLDGWKDEYHILLAIQVATISVLAYGLQVDVFNFPLKSWWLMAAIAPVLFHWARAVPRPIAPLEITAATSLNPLPAR
jgi:O-antigen ligase